MSPSLSYRATPYLTAIATGLFAFAALTHCPVEPWTPPPPEGANTTSTAGKETTPPPEGGTPTDDVAVQDFAFSRDERLLATWTDCACPWRDDMVLDCQMAIWDLSRRSVVATLNPPCFRWRGDVEFSPEGERVYVQSSGTLTAYSASTGEMIYEVGERNEGICRANTQLSADGTRILWTTSCGAVALYRAADGGLIQRFSAETYSESGDASEAWNSRDDVYAFSVELSLTLLSLRDGRSRRVALPPSANRGPVFARWLPDTSNMLLHRIDGLLATLDTVSGRLNVLHGPSALPAPLDGFDLSASGGELLEHTRSNTLELWDLRTGTSRKLGALPSKQITDMVKSSSDDLQSVALFDVPPAPGGSIGVRLFRVPPGSPSGRSEKAPGPSDMPAFALSGDAHFSGFNREGAPIFHTGRALLLFDGKSSPRELARFDEEVREARSTRDRRSVLALGKGLSWVRLSDGKIARFVLERSEHGLTGHIDRVENDADWAAMRGVAP